MAASADISEATVETPLLSTNEVVEGNVDYRGRPVKRSESGRWGSACFIIGVEMAERFAFYGISANLITYLTGHLATHRHGAENVNAWSGTGQLLPLMGGFVADSFLGCYRTIVVASGLYILALGFLALSAVLPSHKPSECWDVSNAMACSPPQLQIIIFFISLYLIAIAKAMHKPRVQAFGADQFDGQELNEAKAKSSFFNWWYFSSCAAMVVQLLLLLFAAMVATLLVLTYVEENLSGLLDLEFPVLSCVLD